MDRSDSAPLILNLEEVPTGAMIRVSSCFCECFAVYSTVPVPVVFATLCDAVLMTQIRAVLKAGNRDIVGPWSESVRFDPTSLTRGRSFREVSEEVVGELTSPVRRAMPVVEMTPAERELEKEVQVCTDSVWLGRASMFNARTVSVLRVVRHSGIVIVHCLQKHHTGTSSFKLKPPSRK